MKLLHKGAVVASLVGGIILAAGGVATADSHATGAAIGSPGVLSGNLIQIPVSVPVNVCGNSINVLALLNPTFGNSCSNGDSRKAETAKEDGRGHADAADTNSKGGHAMAGDKSTKGGKNGAAHHAKADDCK